MFVFVGSANGFSLSIRLLPSVTTKAVDLPALDALARGRGGGVAIYVFSTDPQSGGAF